MTVEQVVYDIKEIKNLLEDDVDIDDLWLLNKINMYRAIAIQEEYGMTQTINPLWLQRSGRKRTTKVNAADDPAIEYSSIQLAKVNIPQVVNLPEDLGLYFVSGSAGMIGFEPANIENMIRKAMYNDERSRHSGWVSRLGNSLLIYPYVMEVQYTIVSADPFDMQIIDGSSFRDMKVTDEYPLDVALAQKVILQVLSNDLRINEAAIGDILNDSQVQLKILKNAAVQSRQE